MLDRRLIRPPRQAGRAALAASLVLVSCGDAQVEKPLPPSNVAPVAVKVRTLTAAEYRPVRDWMIGDRSSAESVRPTCVELDAAPDAPVIRATRNACDRFLSVVTDEDQVLAGISANVGSECAVGDYSCRANVLRGIQGDLVNLGRVLVAYKTDIDAAMSPGPCRDALAPPATQAQVDRAIKTFDDAVNEFARGDNQALLAVLNRRSHGLNDPTPCRPN
jgi:hypothetical protein